MRLSSAYNSLKGKFSDLERKFSSIPFIVITQIYCYHIVELTELVRRGKWYQ